MPCAVPTDPAMIRRGSFWVMGLLVALTACSGIGLGTLTVGATVGEADAGHAPEASPGASTSGGGGGSAGGSGNPPTQASVDAGADAAKAPSLLGSPLCNIMPGGTTCNPDEQACLYDVVPDGGADSGTCTVETICYDAGVASHPAACRVVDSAPACSTLLGHLGEGAICFGSSDCQAELECVGGRGATQGICKRYCCVTTCTGNESFCDIEPVFDSGQLVPVCTSGRSCTPLGTDCIVGTTCTVVNAMTGQTACITPGSARIGDDCLTQNCALDLACISGTCRQLCKGEGPYACVGGSTCMPLTALSEGIGICSD